MMAARPSSANAPGTQEVSTEPSSRTPTFVESQDHLRDAEDVNSEFEHEAYGPAPGEKPEDSYEVIMGPNDPDNPKTWKHWYRWYITALSAILVLNACVFCLFSLHASSSSPVSLVRSHRQRHQES